MFENSDRWIKEKISGITRRSRVTFTAAVAGLLAHGYMLANKLPNYDELTFGTEGIGVTVSSGRWGLEVLHQLSTLLVGGSYSLPWLGGLLAIVFMGLAACYVAKFLDIWQDIQCVLAGSVLVVFPAFTCAMFFMFTARYYAFAIFVMAWGLYQFDRLLSQAGYRGMNQMGSIRVELIPWMVKEVYKGVWLLFTSDFYQVNPTVFLRIVLAVIRVGMAVLAAVRMLPKCREKGGILLTGELLVFTLVLPFCMNGIIVMQPDSWFYTLMEYGVVMVLICPLAVLSVALEQGGAGKRAGSVREPAHIFRKPLTPSLPSAFWPVWRSTSGLTMATMCPWISPIAARRATSLPC